MDSYLRNHAKLMTGLRVVRGPNWKYDNQDGSEGSVGTVVKWKKTRNLEICSTLFHMPNAFFGMVSVIWDNGIKKDYRIGLAGAFDLRVVDNSATGVEHEFTCVQCCFDNHIVGIRCHCEVCDGSICSSCFFKDQHDQTHTKFKRYDTSTSLPVGVVLDQENRNKRIELKGIFEGARVKRGLDWEEGDEDIADGVIDAGWLMGARNFAPGIVQVKWQRYGKTFPYRLGADGKVDLQLVEATSGGFYHPEHLPVLKPAPMKFVTKSGGEIQFAVGDRVQVLIEDEEELKKFFQEGTIGVQYSSFKKFIGKVEIIYSVNELRVVVEYENDRLFNLNPEALLRLSQICNEQPIWTRKSEIISLAMKKKCQPYLARNPFIGADMVLDSDTNNKRKVWYCDKVEMLKKEQTKNKVTLDLKSKMVSALIQAASSGQQDIVKELLTKFPIEIDAQNDLGHTALHAACRNGHLKIVEDLYFMAKGKKVPILEQQDNDGKRAIHHATEGRHSDVLAFLIEPDDETITQGAQVDLNAQDKDKMTPLQIAVQAKSLQTVKLLIEKGSDINSQDSVGNTALHNVILLERHSNQDSGILTALTSSNKINFMLYNYYGFNSLLYSIFVNNHKAFDHLLKVCDKELVISVGSVKDIMFTALEYACYKGELQFAKKLVKHTTKTFPNNELIFFPKMTRWGPRAPLWFAVMQGHYALVEFLMENCESYNLTENAYDHAPVNEAALKIKNRWGEPDTMTSPFIFKVHRELKNTHATTLMRFPGLTMLCYLISKGCPWRTCSYPEVTELINNELICNILQSYEPT